jgi:hypothetical protein
MFFCVKPGRIGLFVAAAAMLLGASIRSVDAQVTPQRIDGLSATGGFVSQFVLSPDGQHVVFFGRYDGSAAPNVELFSSRIDGSVQSTRLNGPLPGFGDVATNAYPSYIMGFTPDGSRVFFSADSQQDQWFDVFSSRVDGSTPAAMLLSGNALNGTARYFTATPDGLHVLFTAAAPGGDFHLYTAPTDGSSTAQTVDTDSEYVFRFTLTSDGTKAVYTSGATQNTAALLWRNSNATGPEYGLSTEYGLSGGVNNVQSGFVVTGDNSHVAFIGKTGTRFELFSRPLDGGFTSPLKLNTLLPTGPYDGGGVSYVAAVPNSNRVIYSGDVVVDGQGDLYSRPADGSTPQVTLSSTQVAGSDVWNDFIVTPNRVIYRGDLNTSKVIELYSSSTDTAGTQQRLSLPLSDNRIVMSFKASDNLSRLLYQAGIFDNPTPEQLFSVAPDGSSSAVLLITALSGQKIRDYEVSPDGHWAAYSIDNTTDTTNLADALFAISTEGSSSPILLSGVPDLAYIHDFMFAPDNTLLFTAETTSGQSRLYSATVPEPATALLSLIPFFCLLRRARR